MSTDRQLFSFLLDLHNSVRAHAIGVPIHQSNQNRINQNGQSIQQHFRCNNCTRSCPLNFKSFACALCTRKLCPSCAEQSCKKCGSCNYCENHNFQSCRKCGKSGCSVSALNCCKIFLCPECQIKHLEPLQMAIREELACQQCNKPLDEKWMSYFKSWKQTDNQNLRSMNHGLKQTDNDLSKAKQDLSKDPTNVLLERLRLQQRRSNSGTISFNCTQFKQCIKCRILLCGDCALHRASSMMKVTPNCFLCSDDCCSKCFLETPEHIGKCSECKFQHCTFIATTNKLSNSITNTAGYVCPNCQTVCETPMHCRMKGSANCPQCKNQSPVSVCHNCSHANKGCVECGCGQLYCIYHQANLIDRYFIKRSCKDCAKLRRQVTILLDSSALSRLPNAICSLILDFSYSFYERFRRNPTTEKPIRQERAERHRIQVKPLLQVYLHDFPPTLCRIILDFLYGQTVKQDYNLKNQKEKEFKSIEDEQKEKRVEKDHAVQQHSAKIDIAFNRAAEVLGRVVEPEEDLVDIDPVLLQKAKIELFRRQVEFEKS